MHIPFVDLKAQYNQIKDEINKAIIEVIESTSFILGKPVQEFELEFAKAHNVKHCIGLSSGTDGNHISLWALDIKSGDEVIIPTNTFIATAWGATLCGAKPVFVDCDPESYNIDPERVESAITSKTKAIVAVHLYGQPADMDRLEEIARHYNVYLVEDAAQAHLAEYKGKRVGGLGIAASFSFYPGKNLGAYGEAGCVTTNSDDLAEKFRMIRDHGSVRKYTHVLLGHNYRMESIQGAVLKVKLKYLEIWTKRRREVANKYRELLYDLHNLEIIKLPKEMWYAKHVYHLFVIQINLKPEKRQEIRDNLRKFLGENGIETGLHYPIPLHLQPCFKSLGYKKGDFPVAEQLAEGGLSLPIYPELTDDKIEYVSQKIHEFFKKKC